MTDRPHLRSLADRAGILPAYFDIAGVERITKNDTFVSLLAAMGFDASTEAAAKRELENLDRSRQQRLVQPCRVVVARAEHTPSVRVTIPGDDPAAVDWNIELHEEDGASHSISGRSKPGSTDRAIVLPLPASPPPGYHTLRVAVELFGGVFEAEQSLIITPGRCSALSQHVGTRRAYGLWTNLYTVRSDRNWGVGDLTDLREVVEAAAEHGAAFVGLNPMHALRNQGDWIGPYCPVSRLFRNLIYLDIEAIPEFGRCRDARARVESREFQTELMRVRSSPYVEYEPVAALKTEILRCLYAVFLEQHVDSASDRGQAYAEYVTVSGKPLTDFATFCALASWLADRGQGGADWREWPIEYRRCDSPEVGAFRSAHQREVDFHCYIQFELDRQLAAVAAEAEPAGMRLGLFPDLAIGSAASGSDAWAFPDLFVEGVELGAPPDPYSETGQTWGFPPIDPRRLEASRYDYWIHLLRGSLAHAGMLRIDHVMGLFRQFWIPQGLAATDGAYVRYPAQDLLGILALESRRHGTVIVGEDLGTVPLEVPPALAEREILSSRVMYFERNADGAFRPADSYSPRALVTATNHDHPPLAGFWTGRDLEIRHEIGLIGSDRELENAQADRKRAREALIQRLLDEGILSDADVGSAQELCAAVHSFLAQTPCPLVGVSLDDLAGETDPVNLPGVPVDRYRSWSRRMGCSIEEILGDPGVGRVLAETRAGRSGPLPS